MGPKTVFYFFTAPALYFLNIFVRPVHRMKGLKEVALRIGNHVDMDPDVENTRPHRTCSPVLG